jgi:hypothetical protein
MFQKLILIWNRPDRSGYNNVSVISNYIFFKNIYLEELLESRILYFFFFNIECYDWILNTRYGALL